MQHSYALSQRGVYDAKHNQLPAACSEQEAKYYQVYLRITPSMLRSTSVDAHACYEICLFFVLFCSWFVSMYKQIIQD